MRVSANNKFAGYSPIAHKCEVYLNGDKLSYCFCADEEMGWVWVYKKDKNNKVLIKNNQIEYEILGGKVEIKCDPKIRKILSKRNRSCV